MNKATQDAIRDRLRDKVEKDFTLLRDYIDTDDLFILAGCAMDMRLWPLDDERHQKAIDEFDRVFDAVMDNYADYAGSQELAEMRQEMADARREERDLEEYGGYDMCDYKHPTWKDRML